MPPNSVANLHCQLSLKVSANCFKLVFFLLGNDALKLLTSPNQQGTMEMRHGLLSSVGAQDTSWQQASDLENNELIWEDLD